MKAINDLYAALRKRREEREIYRLVRDMSPSQRRDIGLHADHASRRAYRI